MKKEIELCDNCEDEKADKRIIKGEDKGMVLCEDCFDEWKDELIDNISEDIK